MTAFGRLAIALGLVGVTATALVGEERFKWWQSDRVKADVGLTAAQSDELEGIFQAILPRMRTEKDELDRLERGFSTLLSEATATEPEVSQAIDRVESARARASKTRLMMLYRMYRVLTPDQRKKLRELHDRRRESDGAARRHF